MSDFTLDMITALWNKLKYDPSNPSAPRWKLPTGGASEMPNNPEFIGEELYRLLENDDFLGRTSTSLQSQISVLAAGINVIPYGVNHCTNLDISAFNGLTHTMDLSQSITFTVGDIVASGYDMKLYTVASGAWTFLANIAVHEAFFILDTKEYFDATPESAIDFLFNNSGAFLTLFDMPVLVAHASSHGSGGSDPVTPAAIGAEPATSLRLLPTGFLGDHTDITAPSGWVLASGNTIGDASSGATERANADAYNLFAMYYNSYNDATLPMQNSSGANIPRNTYATALLAFNAHSRMTIPDLRGRTTIGKDNMGGTAANRVTSGGSGIAGTTMLASGGVETYALTLAQLAAHDHSTNTGAPNVSLAHNHTINDPTHSHSYSGYLSNANTHAAPLMNSDPTTGTYTASTTLSGTGISINNSGTLSHTHTISSAGSGTAHQNVQPSIVVLKIIKL